MSHKSIFQASFEESLNLEKDAGVHLQQEQHLKTVYSFKNGKATIGFRIRNWILTLLIPVGFNYLLVALAKYAIKNGTGKLPISRPTVNLLTDQVYLVLLAIWLGLILFGKIWKQTFILPYRFQFHLYTMMIFVGIIFDLLFVELLLADFSFFVIVGIVLLTLVILSMARSKVRNVGNLLYSVETVSPFLDNLFRVLGIYGMVILGILLIGSKIVPLFIGTPSEAVQDLGLLAFSVILALAMPGVAISIGIPYFLQGYYKLKYPEDYRLWEGKTLEEWYGKKYLKKHSELLDKE